MIHYLLVKRDTLAAQNQWTKVIISGSCLLQVHVTVMIVTSYDSVYVLCNKPQYKPTVAECTDAHSLIVLFKKGKNPDKRKLVLVSHNNYRSLGAPHLAYKIQ